MIHPDTIALDRLQGKVRRVTLDQVQELTTAIQALRKGRHEVAEERLEEAIKALQQLFQAAQD